MNYGIYNTAEKRVITDPISPFRTIEHPARSGNQVSHLRQILINAGIPAADIPERFDGPVTLYHLQVLPADEQRPEPPSVVGYNGRQTAWTVNEGESFSRTIDYQQAGFESFCQQLLDHASAEREKGLDALKAGYSANVVETWEAQRRAAKAWLADNNADATMLRNMAAERGLELQAMADKIMAKAHPFEGISGTLVASADAVEDKVNALKAQSESEALPADWFTQLQQIAENWQNNWPVELKG